MVSRGHHATAAAVEGDHVVCFDNHHSPYAGKTVSVDIAVEDAPSDDYVYDYGDYIDEEDLEAMRKQDVQVIITVVLARIKQTLNYSISTWRSKRTSST